MFFSWEDQGQSENITYDEYEDKIWFSLGSINQVSKWDNLKQRLLTIYDSRENLAGICVSFREGNQTGIAMENGSFIDSSFIKMVIFHCHV